MRARVCWRSGLSLIAAGMLASAHAVLYGIKWDDGALYKINQNTAAITKIGDTNVAGMADIQFGADGFLYGFTTGLNSKVYKIDPANASTTSGPSLGLAAGTFVFEGAMAYDSGTKFWCAATQDAGRARIFKLDVSNGNVSDAFTLNGDYDFNGWAFPRDVLDNNGSLTAINRESGKFETVDLDFQTSTPGDAFPSALGEVGGMTTDDVFMYAATGGPGSVIAGSNKLYAMDMSMPGSAWVEKGTFTGMDGWGFSGIAAVPEPSSCIVLGSLLYLARRRKSK